VVATLSDRLCFSFHTFFASLLIHHSHHEQHGNKNQPVYMKLDANSLSPIWVKTITFSNFGGAVEITAVSSDANDNVILGGYLGSCKSKKGKKGEEIFTQTNLRIDSCPYMHIHTDNPSRDRRLWEWHQHQRGNCNRPHCICRQDG
jgi:hypothetical protein